MMRGLYWIAPVVAVPTTAVVIWGLHSGPWAGLVGTTYWWINLIVLSFLVWGLGLYGAYLFAYAPRVRLTQDSLALYNHPFKPRRVLRFKDIAQIDSASLGSGRTNFGLHWTFHLKNPLEPPYQLGLILLISAADRSRILETIRQARPDLFPKRPPVAEFIMSALPHASQCSSFRVRRAGSAWSYLLLAMVPLGFLVYMFSGRAEEDFADLMLGTLVMGSAAAMALSRALWLLVYDFRVEGDELQVRTLSRGWGREGVGLRAFLRGWEAYPLQEMELFEEDINFLDGARMEPLDMDWWLRPHTDKSVKIQVPTSHMEPEEAASLLLHLAGRCSPEPSLVPVEYERDPSPTKSIGTPMIEGHETRG